MTQLGHTFDATAVEPNQPFEVIPAGKYKVQIVASEIRATKNGEGQYLWMELEIIDGEYQGRKLWDRLNLWNNNQQAVDIAQRTLSAICHAVGELHVSDTETLHFKPMITTVRVKPADGQYSASNELRGYEAVAGGPAPAQPAARAPAATAPAAQAAPRPAVTTRPWATQRRSS